MTRTPRPCKTISNSLHRQLNSYALAAGAAGVGALALVLPAEAKIIYTPAHAKVIFGHPVALDLNHDGIVDFYLNSYREYSIAALSACEYLNKGSRGPFCSSVRGTNAIRTKDSNGVYWGAALRYGAKIQPGNRFPNGGVRLGELFTSDGFGTNWAGPWLNGGKGVKDRYLGLKFEIGGRFHFGWARIAVMTTSNSFTATLTGYAYETIPGKAIIAGATKGPDDAEPTESNTNAPEPATLGMFALGAMGLSIWRREEAVVPSMR